jgi:hypothetical protein
VKLPGLQQQLARCADFTPHPPRATFTTEAEIALFGMMKKSSKNINGLKPQFAERLMTLARKASR